MSKMAFLIWVKPASECSSIWLSLPIACPVIVNEYLVWVNSGGNPRRLSTIEYHPRAIQINKVFDI